MVNKVTLIGNLGADPEIRMLESGAKVARLSVATNESYKDKSGEWQQQTEWHNVVAWRYMADRAERLSKGDQVFVSGKINYRKYTDKDNIERYSTDIVARELRVLGKMESQGDYEGGQSSRSSQSSSDTSGMDPFDKKLTTPASSDSGSGDDMEDDLPF